MLKSKEAEASGPGRQDSMVTTVLLTHQGGRFYGQDSLETFHNWVEYVEETCELDKRSKLVNLASRVTEPVSAHSAPVAEAVISFPQDTGTESLWWSSSRGRCSSRGSKLSAGT